MSDRRTALPGSTLLLWIVLPILPFAVGFLVLGLVDHPVSGVRAHLPGKDAFHDEGLDLRFFNALLGYGALAIIQVLSCAAVIAMLALHVARMPAQARVRVLAMTAASLILLWLISVAVRQDGSNGALWIGYRYPCMVLLNSGVAGHILPDSCDGEGLSRLAWFALVPYMAGLAAAAFASAVVASAFGRLPPGTAEEIAADLKTRSALVEQSFRMTAFILVISTLALVLFYRLPLALIEDDLATELMTGYAQAITFFWGVLFTLTLAAIFGPGTLILKRRLREAGIAPGDVDLPEQLLPHGAKERLAGLLTTLAPLLIGASGSVLEQIASAL